MSRDKGTTRAQLLEELELARAALSEAEAKSEEAARREGALLSSVVESSDNVVIFVLDRDYKYLCFNRAHVAEMKKIYNADIEIGAAILDCMPREDDRLKAKENYERALRGERFVKVEEYGLSDNRFWYELHFNPLYDEREQVSGFTVFVTDTTEHSRVEEALRESEARFRGYFELGLIGMAITSTEMRWVEFNQKLCSMFGYSREEFAKLTWAELTHPEDLDSDVAQFKRVTAGEIDGYSLEKRFFRKDGCVLRAEISARAIRKSDGSVDHFVALVYDLTERKRAEEALHRSEALLRGILDHSPALVSTKDLEGNVTLANRRFEVLKGPSPEEFVDRNIFDLFPRHVAETLWENDLKARQGLVEAEETVEHADGSLHAYLSVKFPLTDDEGTLVGTGAISTDITERKRAEEDRRRLEAQVQHSQKLESLGILAGGIAHDFNNLLVGILGNADLAYDDLPSHSAVRPLLSEILKASRQAAGLTNQMLAYSGKGHFVVEALDLNTILRDMQSLLESSISRKVALKHDLVDDLPAILGDASQLRQIAMNLVTNASDACEEMGGQVEIRTRMTECDRAFLDQISADQELLEGRYISFEVSDSGCGMDEETKRKVFDPFFTTKSLGRGLGMAAVQGIIRGHKGAIRIESEPGVGTTFRVLFPALDHQGEASKVGVTPANDWHGDGTILVVDDVVMVRDLVTSVLERLGLTVLTASDGAQAVELFLERHAEIDCVLLDLKMPNMGGEETFDELRKIRPDVPVILSSGYSEQESMRQFAGKGLAGFIQKPYRLSKLREKLRAVLGG